MRRSGQTTRMVDAAVQCLFTHEAVFFPVSLRDRDLRPLDGTVYHPYRGNRKDIIFSDGETITEQRHLVETFLRRISMEHSLEYRGRNLPIGTLITLSDFEPKRMRHYPFPETKKKDKFNQQEPILLKTRKSCRK